MKYYRDNSPNRPYFDKFDICEAWHILEINYNESGVLQQRKSNTRRHMSADYQLGRMEFKPRPSLDGYRSNLTPNGKQIYKYNVRKLGLGAICYRIHDTPDKRLKHENRRLNNLIGFKEIKYSKNYPVFMNYNIKYYKYDIK